MVELWRGIGRELVRADVRTGSPWSAVAVEIVGYCGEREAFVDCVGCRGEQMQVGDAGLANIPGMAVTKFEARVAVALSRR